MSSSPIKNPSVSERSPGRLRRVALGVMGAIVLALIVVGLPLLLRTFVVEMFRVPAGSMIPTLRVGDTFLVKKYAYSRSSPPRRGDVVVFKFPVDPSQDFVKRVVAIAGDSISVCSGQVRLNGQPLPRAQIEEVCDYTTSENDSEPLHRIACTLHSERSGDASYVTMSTREAGQSAEPCAPALTIPEGQLFVLGDNRDNSYDSRFWGLVPTENVRGKAWLIWIAGSPMTARERWLRPIR